MTARLAIYYAPPPGSPLEAFGCQWLGRDHRSGRALTQPSLPGVAPDRLALITASPRYYGFHATLKAPFALAAEQTEAALLQALASFAAEQAPVACPPLQVADVSGFIALILSRPAPALQRFAAECVRAFDPFRAAASPAEIAKRRASGLSPRQDEQLLRWGYPYVLDDFQFHMTLTERLVRPELDRMLAVLRARAAALTTEPFVLDAISLYRQPDRDAPFLLEARLPLLGR